MPRFLTEAGTDTSTVDLAARPIVDAAIHEVVARLVSRDLPTLDTQPNHMDAQRLFVSILSRYRGGSMILDAFCDRLSDQLTKVVQRDLRNRFGNHIRTVVYGDFDVTQVSVRIEPTNAPSGVDEETKTLHIHIDGSHMLNALLAVFAKEALQLTVPDGYDILRSLIVGHLVHEYAHFIQGILSNVKPTSLGGDPNRFEDIVRYLGTAEEIDSLSSQAVAELTRMVDANHDNLEDVFDDIRNAIATGQAASRTYNVYLKMLKNTFAGHYDTLDPHEISRMWKRFTKLVWQKLGAYVPKAIGKAHSSQDMQPQWVAWARRLPRSAFIIWLAGHVADELIASKPRYLQLDKLMSAVDDDTSGNIQHQAERFLENYYFGFGTFDPHSDRVIRIFRKIVKRKLMRHAVSKKAA